MAPDVGWIKPATSRSRLDLPQPDGPTITVNSFSSTSREMRSSAVTGCLIRGVKRSEEHTSELQSQSNIVCRLLLEKKKREKSKAARDTCALVYNTRVVAGPWCSAANSYVLAGVGGFVHVCFTAVYTKYDRCEESL